MLSSCLTGMHYNQYSCMLYETSFVCFLSSAQLLEPFRLNHDIQLISGGAGILTSSSSVGDLDRAPGAPTTGIMPSTLVVGATTEQEDPPGLYEKVSMFMLLLAWMKVCL